MAYDQKNNKEYKTYIILKKIKFPIFPDFYTLDGGISVKIRPQNQYFWYFLKKQMENRWCGGSYDVPPPKPIWY